MLIKYNGEYAREVRSYSGCSKCGTGRTTGGKEVYKTETKIFDGTRFLHWRVGETLNVDELIGRYLLRKTYVDKDGTEKHQFEEVSDATTTDK